MIIHFGRKFSYFLDGFRFLKGLRRSMMNHRFVDMRIPDKWRDYTCCGLPIKGERIITLKTPLSEQFESKGGNDNGLKEHERFTPRDAVEIVRTKTKQSLALVIDLTNTNRYYKAQDFIREGVDHLKIKCEGREIPNDNVYERMKNAIVQFLKDDETGLVGVHCTHGLNRTGYLLCRYLIETRGYEAQDAIHAFNKGRGYAIERINYLQHLHELKPSPNSKDYVSTSKSEDCMDPRALEKWFKYSTCGKVVKNEKLIPFKTLLSDNLFKKYEKERGHAVRPEERFTPNELIKCVELQNEKLGLVIDLSPYIKCYNSKEFTSEGIDYKKMKYTPDEEFITRVKKDISIFFKKCPDGLVGIHCVNGVNLTGYVICRYLIDCKGYSPTKAIQAFFHARGYSIEDLTLLEKLNSLAVAHPPTRKMFPDPRDSKKPDSRRSSAIPSSSGHTHMHGRQLHTGFPQRSSSYQDTHHRHQPSYSNYSDCSNWRDNGNDRLTTRVTSSFDTNSFPSWRGPGCTFGARSSYNSESQLTGYSTERSRGERYDRDYQNDSYSNRQYGVFDDQYLMHSSSSLERNIDWGRERTFPMMNHLQSVGYWDGPRTRSTPSTSQSHTQPRHHTRVGDKRWHTVDKHSYEEEHFKKHPRRSHVDHQERTRHKAR